MEINNIFNELFIEDKMLFSNCGNDVSFYDKSTNGVIFVIEYKFTMCEAIEIIASMSLDAIPFMEIDKVLYYDYFSRKKTLLEKIKNGLGCKNLRVIAKEKKKEMVKNSMELQLEKKLERLFPFQEDLFIITEYLTDIICLTFSLKESRITIPTELAILIQVIKNGYIPIILEKKDVITIYVC